MMEINATLLGQIITFAVFIWFTMKFVWPPLMKAMEERRQKIADGLAAADKARHDLELADLKAKNELQEAKNYAAQIIEQANHRANRIIEEAKEQARSEGDRMLEMAQEEIQRQYQQTRGELLHQISELAVLGAEKIVRRSIDKASNEALINELIDEVQ